MSVLVPASVLLAIHFIVLKSTHWELQAATIISLSSQDFKFYVTKCFVIPLCYGVRYHSNATSSRESASD